MYQASIIGVLVFSLSLRSLAQVEIKIDQEYPQYWNVNGTPTLLLGGSVEDNLFQIPDIKAHLDLLASIGGNYVRNTMSSRDEGNVWPFYFDKTQGKYDLSRWNQEYWQRFEKFLILTSERKVIVQVEIWATFDFYRDNWDVNPFNPKNNLNYDSNRVDLPTKIPTHPIYTDNPFFWSIPDQQNNMRLLWYQQQYVDKILSYTLKYGNVLYCIDNETSVTASWGRFWAGYITKKAKEQKKNVFVTEMWDPHNLDHISHRETFDHPETYKFVEISQNNHQKGQQHWENGLKQIDRLKASDYLRPVNNVKTYGNDEGRHGHGSKNGMESFIRSVFFGSAAVRFHRPNSGLGLSKQAQSVIKSMRELTNRMEFFDASPNNTLLKDREPNEAYCRAINGKQYAVFFTDGGEVSLDLSASSGAGDIVWLNVLSSQWSGKEIIQSNQVLDLKPPTAGPHVALISFK
jgi:hypothetical protein